MKPEIPKLTKKERRMWIKALKETLEKYKNKEFYKNCPLCAVDICFNCIWRRFTGMGCTRYNLLKRGSYISDFTDPRWVKLRLGQIPRWIKKLEEGL